MLNTLRIAGLVATCALAAPVASAPPCAPEAIEQARKLLAFHFGEDDRISVDDEVRALPSLRNPANPKQKFIVLETMGHIYKGEYRMRLIYYPIGDECVLMGQEILELATL